MPQVTEHPHQGALKGRESLTIPDDFPDERPDLFARWHEDDAEWKVRAPFFSSGDSHKSPELDEKSAFLAGEGGAEGRGDMLISEIFYSLQGEGVLTGVPSVFVRTSGCNLRCRWCDTPYASWDPEGDEMGVEEILGAVGRWPVARHVVITGGEPMVARGVRELAAALRGKGYHITIETAGTIEPGGIACDLASLSPKLAHSVPREGEAEPGWIRRHEEARFRPEVLRSWHGHAACQWKFVISDRDDLGEMQRMMAEVGCAVEPSEILLMPEGRSAEELAVRSAWLSDVCLETGHRFCQRLHIALYGNRRGT